MNRPSQKVPYFTTFLRRTLRLTGGQHCHYLVVLSNAGKLFHFFAISQLKERASFLAASPPYIATEHPCVQSHMRTRTTVTFLTFRCFIFVHWIFAFGTIDYTML
ncbi:unnamed protein product, partial [Iphiclides podalirius]